MKTAMTLLTSLVIVTATTIASANLDPRTHIIKDETSPVEIVADVSYNRIVVGVDNNAFWCRLVQMSDISSPPS